MKTRFWEISSFFGDASHAITRRLRADELKAGSGPRSEIKLSRPAPEQIFSILRTLTDKGELKFWVSAKAEGVEYLERGKWISLTEYSGTELPSLRWGPYRWEIRDLSDQRVSFGFEPERWADEANGFEDAVHALWHIRDGVLVEAVMLRDGNREPVQLKCGYRMRWDSQSPDAMELVEYDGIPQRLEVGHGRGGHSHRALFENNIFLFTRVPKKARLEDLPIGVKPVESSPFGKIIFGVGLTWILIMAMIQMAPARDPLAVVALEELPDSIAKIILEAPRPSEGGNGQRGGGGSEEVAGSDQRGGSGFEANQMASQGSTAEEIFVQDKGALAALSKAEKVIGGGMMRALAATGAIATALSALDEGVKAGKVRTAGAGAPSTGAGSASGVLGALSSVAAKGTGSGGVGIGGVGTKGFGGGGGGGQGSGFGTGIGSGLGAGSGARDIAFDASNVAVRGGLERSEVDAVIQENIAQIRYCYNQGLRTNRDLQGKITTTFVISADGKVKSSRIASSTLGSPTVDNCVKDRVLTWQFPRPRGGGEVAVNYPFLLRR